MQAPKLEVSKKQDAASLAHQQCATMQVLSGQLVAPELPELVERTEMTDLVDTYGKSIHTWQIDRGDKLPFGACPTRPNWHNTSQPLRLSACKQH